MTTPDQVYQIVGEYFKRPKPEGPVKNLRPVDLLPVIRKVLSKGVLKRSEKAIEGYLSKTQAEHIEQEGAPEM